MKRSELGRLFTDCVTEAVSEGFYPCLTEMSGTYGEVMGTQMVFAKGSEREIMWMEETERLGLCDNEVLPHVTAYIARIRLGDGEALESDYFWPKDWKEHVIHSEVVYRVSSGARSDDWYSASQDDAREASRKRRERFANSEFGINCKEFEVTDKLMAIVRKLKGFKTVSRENVKVWKFNGVWHIANTKSKNETTLSA